MEPGARLTDDSQRGEARAELDRLDTAIAQSTADGNLYVVASLHFKAAQICLASASRREVATREEALAHLWASWQLQPDDLDVRTVLAHYLEHDNQLDEAANLYRSSAEHIQNEKERSALLLRAAHLLRVAGELDEALLVLRQLESVRDQEVAVQRFRAIRTLYAALGEEMVGERIETLGLLLPFLEGDERFEHSLQLARLHAQLGDDEAAQAAYREALAVRPAAPEALEPVRRHLRDKGADRELSDVLETAARHAARDAQLPLLRELAELADAQLADPGRAVRFHWRAWELDPNSTHEPAQLKRIYAETEQWTRYRRVLEHEALRAPDADRKINAYRELATLLQQLFEDDAGAAGVYSFILHLVPDDEAALAARVEIFEKRGQEVELATALRRCAAHTRDRRRRDGLLRRLARIQSRSPQAGHLLRTLNQLDPALAENRQLLRELRDQSSAMVGHPFVLELGALLLKWERDAGLAPERCVALALELGEESLQAGQVGRAAECYRAVLEIAPNHSAAREGLATLAQRGELVDPTSADLAERAAAVADDHPHRAVRLLVQAAQLAQREQGKRESAAGYLRQAMEHCPPATGAEYQLLEEALRSSEMFQDLAQLLEMQAEAEDVRSRRKDTLRALARLYREQLDEPGLALEVLGRVLALDPADPEVTEEVRRLHKELGNHAALARVLENMLAEASGRERIPLLAELGRLYADKLPDRAAALSRYGELLAMVPADPAALAYCRAHDEANGNYRAVAVLLCRAAEATSAPVDRAELHREIAQIAEQRLSDPEFAITHWRQVVDLCPADSAPRAELKRLLAQVGRWHDLERVLLSEISRSLRPEEKVPVYFELARVAYQHTQDESRASGYLRNALQLAPENREVLGQLEGIYERLGHWRELAAVLRRHAEAVPDTDEKAKLLQRAARVLFVHLGRDEEALAICRLIREMRPGDRGAATLAAEIYTKRGKWREKTALLREQIDAENDPPELGRLHLELGRLLLDKMDDSETAAGHFEQALELASGAAEILPLLRQLYESLGRWDLLVELIRKRATAESVSNTERAIALCEIGRITADQLGDPVGAKEAFERAIHLDPNHRPALAALRALATARKQWRDLIALARRELQLTEDPAERARLQAEIGEILYRQLERPGAAAEALEEALTLDPNNSSAAELLGMIYFDTEDWERAGQLLEKVVGSGMELDNLHEYYYRLGYATERLGREDDAFSYYVKSFGREPMFLPTLTRLVDLCYTRNQWENTLRIGEAIVTTYVEKKTPMELADLYLRIGLCELHLAQRDVAVKQLQNMILEHGEVPSTPSDAWVDAAESWAATPLEPTLLGQVNADVLGRVVKAMERALVHVTGHAGALQVLAALSLSRRDWERSLRYIERAVESITDDPRLLVGLLVCAGDVAHKHLLSAQRARAYYRRAREILPGSELARERLDMLEVTPTRGAEAPTLPAPRRRPMPSSRAPAIPSTRTPPPSPPSRTPPPSLSRTPPPVPLPQDEELVSKVPTKPLPVLMPPIPSDDEESEDPAAPVPSRPAPRSRPRRPDDD